MFNLRLSLGVLFLSSLLAACEKEDVVSSTNQAQAEELTSEEALAEDIFEDTDAISLEAVTYSESSRLHNDSITSSACVTRTVTRSESNAYEKTVTLTFAEGCVGPEGRERNGTITVKRELTATTYTVTTTFQDFYLEGKKIEGTRVMTYAQNDRTSATITAKLIDGKVTLRDGRIVTRHGEFVKTWNRETGESSLTGTAQGVTRNGVAYTASIQEPIVYKRDCMREGIFLPVQGTKSITREGKADFIVNYGSGSCDKQVMIDAEGEQYEVSIDITKQ